jgi:hypothetical protein
VPYRIVDGSPVNVPDVALPLFAAAVGVGVALLVGVGVALLVGVGVALFVAAGVGVVFWLPVTDADLVGVGFVVGVGFLVAAFELLALGAGVDAAVAAGVAVLPVSVDGAKVPPPIPVADSDEVNVGGVIERTAPRLPTVPPAINSALFITALSPSYL